MPDDLPEPNMQSLIADAVHHALSKLFEPSVNHVAPINTIGCFLLQHLMQREYRPVAGSVRVRAGGTPFGLEADINQIDMHEYYVWIQGDRPDGRVELVDFASRYWLDWARGLGVLWLGPPPPDFLWGWADAIPPALAEHETHPEITVRLQHTVVNAIAARDPQGPVPAWEKAVNDAIDYIASSDEGLDFLAKAGLAEPIDDEKPGDE